MRPKILFIGGTPRGLELIKMLTAEKYTIVYAFILQEDDHEPIKVSDAIAKICREQRIPATICKKVEVTEIPDVLALKPDVAFVCGWRTILSGHLYNQIPYGCLAAHDSLLPKYRGFAPTAWAIINGEQETGVTLFKISDGEADSGDMAGQKVIPIKEHETATEIYPKVVSATTELYKEFLQALEGGKVSFQEQDHSKATLAKRRTPADGEINWKRAAGEINNLIRALQPPYPYAWTVYKGRKYYIKKAYYPDDMMSFNEGYPGRVVSIKKEGVLVSCGSGQIFIQEFISESGKLLDAAGVIESAQAVLGEGEWTTNKSIS